LARVSPNLEREDADCSMVQEGLTLERPFLKEGTDLAALGAFPPLDQGVIEMQNGLKT
jgi:hypothetical protein